jgi:hypothetical protein
MPDNEDWLFRPMLEGLCKYESLVSETTLDLCDVARMNDALDIRAENTRRLQKYYKDHPDEV